ncbi:MAG: NIPSNAP family protein [Bacteroidota bacterium]
MKRRKFIKGTAAGSLLTGTLHVQASTNQTPAREFYELREYSLRGASIPAKLSTYLEGALIPALNRNGVSKVGAFEKLGKPQPTTLFLLIAYKDGQNFLDMDALLASDEAYQSAAREFWELGPDQAQYVRAESTILEAFTSIPQFKQPPKRSELFELRIYESHNQAFHKRKVQMFDKEELDLFYKVGLNPVFFGACKVGRYAPQLTYMLHFKDMEERDSNWKAFIEHPDWNEMKAKPEYVGTVSNISRYFLTRASFSQM